MKGRWLLLSLGVFAMISLTGFAQQAFNFKLPETSEPIYGTWVNPENAGTYWRDAQKWVFSNWGFGTLFEKASDEQPAKQFTFILVEKWADSEGNTWYKAYQQFSVGRFYLTVRIGGNSTVLELLLAGGFMKESDLDPKTTKGMYLSFHRE